jgi:hypothetical protein
VCSLRPSIAKQFYNAVAQLKAGPECLSLESVVYLVVSSSKVRGRRQGQGEGKEFRKYAYNTAFKPLLLIGLNHSEHISEADDTWGLSSDGVKRKGLGRKPGCCTTSPRIIHVKAKGKIISVLK